MLTDVVSGYTPAAVLPRAGKRSGLPNGLFNRLTMVRIGAVYFRCNQWLNISLRTDFNGYSFG